MFSAALATLYAGTGKMLYVGAIAIDPRVVELHSSVRNSEILGMDAMLLHVGNLLELAALEQRQESGGDEVGACDIHSEGRLQVGPLGTRG